MVLEELGPPAKKWLFILQSFIFSLRTRFLHAECTKAYTWWKDVNNIIVHKCRYQLVVFATLIQRIESKSLVYMYNYFHKTNTSSHLPKVMNLTITDTLFPVQHTGVMKVWNPPNISWPRQSSTSRTPYTSLMIQSSFPRKPSMTLTGASHGTYYKPQVVAN